MATSSIALSNDCQVRLTDRDARWTIELSADSADCALVAALRTG